MKIELPAFQQSRPYTCLATCLRSVLSALGSDFSEDELAERCKTEPVGSTLPDAAAAARSLGFNALYLPEATFEILSEWLGHGVPMIVGVAADQLEHTASSGDAIVICGVEHGKVVCVDPATSGETQLVLERFLRAWRRRGNRGLVITR